jgi:hypothetical protein
MEQSGLVLLHLPQAYFYLNQNLSLKLDACLGIRYTQQADGHKYVVVRLYSAGDRIDSAPDGMLKG